MNDLENGYFEVSSSGKVQFISFSSLGSGLFMIILLVCATVFIQDANEFLVNNKWVIIIPTLISVLYRTLVFDAGLRLYKRIINIVGDTVKSLCMFGVLLAVIDEVAGSHWLDRVLFAFLYGILLFAVNWLIETGLQFLRGLQFYRVHLIVCLVISALALCFYYGHAWHWRGYEYKAFCNKASIVSVDEQMEGVVTIPWKLGDCTVESIEEDAFRYSDRITYIELPNTVKVMSFGVGFMSSLQGIEIPKSLEKIEKPYFALNYDFEIYYEGSREEWEKIDIQDDNVKNMTVHFNWR